MRNYYLHATSIIIIFMLSCLNVNAIRSSTSRNDMFRKYGKLSFEELYRLDKAMTLAHKPDMALNFCNLVIKQSDMKMPRSKMLIYGCCLNDAGTIYFLHKNNYIKAYSLFLKGMEIANKLKNDSLKANLYQNFGRIYSLLCDDEDCIDRFKKAFYCSKKTKEWNVYVFSFNCMMLFAFYNNSAKDYNDEISVFNATKLPEKYEKKTKYFSYKGILSYINKDYDASIDYFKATSIDLKKLKAPIRYFASNLNLLAKVYMAKHDYANALKTADECKSLVLKKGTMPDFLSDTYQIYSECYEKMGMKEKSKDYQLAYYKLSDSLFDFRKFTILQNIDNMNKTMARDLLAQKEEYNQKLQIHTIVMLLIFLFIATIMSIILYRNNKTLHDANVALYRKWNEKQNISKDENNKQNESAESNKYKTNHLDLDFKENLHKKIDDVLNNNKEVFSPDFTIEKLAELVESNATYVSQIVNVYYEKNFSIVVGEIRVREACRRIVDIEHYGNLTMEAIAYDTGFKTRQNFNLIFKKVTGLSPSQYKKMSQEDIQKDGDDFYYSLPSSR